ncbi:hypothetical protein OfM1_15500 [Lactovum odontotermitis]
MSIIPQENVLSNLAVRYPREISQRGLDYFDKHPEQLKEVPLSVAMRRGFFLKKGRKIRKTTKKTNFFI